MSDYITVRNTRNQVIEAISKLRQDISKHYNAAYQRGVMMEKMRILNVLSEELPDNEAEESEQKCLIILRLMDKIQGD
jgi:hypothetical protein